MNSWPTACVNGKCSACKWNFSHAFIFTIHSQNMCFFLFVRNRGRNVDWKCIGCFPGGGSLLDLAGGDENGRMQIGRKRGGGGWGSVRLGGWGCQPPADELGFWWFWGCILMFYDLIWCFIFSWCFMFSYPIKSYTFASYFDVLSIPPGQYPSMSKNTESIWRLKVWKFWCTAERKSCLKGQILYWKKIIVTCILS